MICDRRLAARVKGEVYVKVFYWEWPEWMRNKYIRGTAQISSQEGQWIY